MTEYEKTVPSLDILKKIVSYNPYTGVISWLLRGVDLFPDAHARACFNARRPGRKIEPRANGYVVVTFTMDGVIYNIQGHRLAYAMETGAWPTAEIDHENLDRGDNRFANLRDATHFQNNQNKSKMKTNVSGFKGVHFHKGSGLWRAQITVGDNRKDLGLHETPELAGAAYAAASKDLHGQFSKV